MRGFFNIRRDYVEMSNKKDYKIFRRTSKVLPRDIVFREIIRTLIILMRISKDGSGWSLWSRHQNFTKSNLQNWVSWLFISEFSGKMPL